jgi:hypothetical protein
MNSNTNIVSGKILENLSNSIILEKSSYFTIIDDQKDISSFPYYGISKVSTNADQSQTVIEHSACNIILTGAGLRLFHEKFIEETVRSVRIGVPFTFDDSFDKIKIHLIEDVQYVYKEED